MKKTKFRKLSRVLISISLLAIIAVSLISVPVSAAEGDSIVGSWVIRDNFDYPSSDLDQIGGLNFAGGHYYWYDQTDGSIKEAPLGYFHLTGTSSSYTVRFSANYDGNGGTGGGTGYPSTNIYRSKVEIWITPSSSVTLNPSFSSFTLTEEEYIQLRTVTFYGDPLGSDGEAFKTWLFANADKVVPPSPTLLENILGTFSEVGSWIGTIISSLVALFWSVETASLTFLGILSVAGLAFSVIMLLFGFVTRFVGFSG